MNTIEVELILSIVIAVAALIYAVINIFMLRENRATRIQKVAPMIVPFLKMSENQSMLELHVKNIGEGIAKDVKFYIIEDCIRFEKEDVLLSDTGIFKNGMTSFPPGYELRYFLVWSDSAESYKDKQIKLKVKYQDIRKKKYGEVFTLPIKEIMGQGSVKPPETYMGQIPYYLKEINNTIKKIEQKG